MRTAFGTFNWIGTLPSDDAIGTNPEPKVSDDFGEQWAYEVNRLVATDVHADLLSDPRFTSVGAPTDDEHCWSIPFVFEGRQACVWLQWIPDGDRDNGFAFDIGYRYNFLQTLLRRTREPDALQAMRHAVDHIFRSAPLIENVVWDRRILSRLAGNHAVHRRTACADFEVEDQLSVLGYRRHSGMKHCHSLIKPVFTRGICEPARI